MSTGSTGPDPEPAASAPTDPEPHDTWRDVGEGLVGAAGILLDLVTPFLRNVRSHWGVDEATAARPHPGDELVPQPRWSWTHGIEIDAPPERVWPWVVQIGQGKAGFYSYQWLENLAGCHVQNADRVHEEWQELHVGDALRLHPKMPPMKVAEVEPGRFFVVHGGFDPRSGQALAADDDVRVTWLFLVEPLPDGRSRFISRFRSDFPEGLANRLMYGPTVTESMGFVMDRKMLLGVKERVEGEG